MEVNVVAISLAKVSGVEGPNGVVAQCRDDCIVSMTQIATHPWIEKVVVGVSPASDIFEVVITGEDGLTTILEIDTHESPHIGMRRFPTGQPDNTVALMLMPIKVREPAPSA